ncbi:MAG: SAM-dependent methyltransferase, partial [Bacteroidales bacterium]|nr:SAM-dependent methyltransferase [Bacteroidales bacterium]
MQEETVKALDDLFQRLGLNTSNGLYFFNDVQWKTKLHFPSRIERLLQEKIRPYAFFCIDNKPLVLFFSSPVDNGFYKKIWNFNESPIVIVTHNGSITIYNGFKYNTSLMELEQLGDTETEIDNFAYFALVTGKTWDRYQKELARENRLDYFLLNNIKTTRNILVTQKHLAVKIANALIGKCIFIRYLLDRKVKLNVQGYLKKWNNDEFCGLLKDISNTKKFFDYIKQKFNGDDIFGLTDSEYDQIKNEDLDVLIRLLKSEDLETGQRSLFDVYDFSIIPIEFISNIYELFIGKDRQEEQSAYYTPLFLVDYILGETIEKKFLNCPQSDGCIILDPACGSGVFLVEALRKIIEQYRVRNPDKALTPAILRDIASKNIYGIDADPNAIQVALFSIYLTLLDYQDPAVIDKFKFPALLNKNFFKANFFDTYSGEESEEDDTNFEKKLKPVKFDYILGNPPWKGSGLGDIGKEYIKNRKKEEKRLCKKYSIDINNNEIAECFILRASDFSNLETKIAFIVRSSILYNMGYSENFSKFRRYLLEEYFIHKIVELAPVRHEVFDRSNDPSIAPAAIMFYQYAYGDNTDNNVLEHITIRPSLFFSQFKIFTIMRPDYKEVEQKLLKEYDWLFKTLVYGSYLDFNFIKRLKERYTSVERIISNNSDLICGTGIHCRREAQEHPKDTKDIENIPMIKPFAIEAFYIDYDKQDVLEKEKVDIVKNVKLYHAPMLLIRKGPDLTSLSARAAISLNNVIFKDSITSVKSLGKNVFTLKIILGLLTSDLYTYMVINTFASTGIEREQIEKYNMFNMPYIDYKAIDLIESIEKLMIDLYNAKKKIFNESNCSKIEKEISDARKQLNTAIKKALKISKREDTLIDYALTINRPLIPLHGEKKHLALQYLIKPLQTRSIEIIEYIKIFFDRFKPDFDDGKNQFIARVWRTEHIIGIFFEVVSLEAQTDNGIIWEEVREKRLLTTLIRLSSEELTDRLFVLKDIRGFEKERFYIFKPNEKWLWHKAIAYLDVDDFMDAILRA